MYPLCTSFLLFLINVFSYECTILKYEHSFSNTKYFRQISETSAAWSSQKVADKILNDITNALFLSHFGPIGWLLSISTASCAPVHAVSHFVIEILLAGIVRFVSLFFQWDFNSKIQHALANEMKERQKAAKDD